MSSCSHPLICLDTIALVWGVQGVCRPGEERLVVRAQSYVRAARDAGRRLAVPAPVLFEYLAGLKAEQQPEAGRVIEDGFVILPFDPPAATIAAELHARRFGRRAASAPARRQAAKFDFTVLGIAVASGATELLTDDEHFVEWAGGRVPVRLIRDLPDPATGLTTGGGSAIPPT